MDADAVVHMLQTWLIYVVNGGLVLVYAAWARLAALLTAGAFLTLVGRSPVHRRPWLAGMGTLAVLAAGMAEGPVPFLLAGMAMAGALAVYLDRHAPETLAWRVAGGLTLYAGAALAYVAYSRYLAGLDAASWAAALGGQEAARLTLGRGRAFLETLATWGLWLIMPLGYGSLLAQGILVHPPAPARPTDIIATVRTRNHDPAQGRGV